eukprot:TRINITY_DN8350_c0_g1_i2.p1 TRINITY_DN8350_c0_g1~~TRINITY_DN8350_c0_g1_i2.p1  ORF type:complete len:272 (+),score=37.94 TRINITY_DN8350_c0_g1_i2:40-855(+)
MRRKQVTSINFQEIQKHLDKENFSFVVGTGKTSDIRPVVCPFERSHTIALSKFATHVSSCTNKSVQIKKWEETNVDPPVLQCSLDSRHYVIAAQEPLHKLYCNAVKEEDPDKKKRKRKRDVKEERKENKLYTICWACHGSVEFSEYVCSRCYLVAPQLLTPTTKQYIFDVRCVGPQPKWEKEINERNVRPKLKEEKQEITLQEDDQKNERDEKPDQEKKLDQVSESDKDTRRDRQHSRRDDDDKNNRRDRDDDKRSDHDFTRGEKRKRYWQ